MASITFVVNTPVVRVLTFKQFKKMDETKGFSEEKLKSVWEKMLAALTDGAIVAEANTGIEEENEDYVWGEVNDLVDSTISDAADEVDEVEDNE
jgi:hypothetical protein